MPNRRDFLMATGAGLAVLAVGPEVIGADGTRLTYALDVEAFWKRLPMADRLRKVAESGFTRYEFGPWKTKDVDAMVKLGEELGLQPALFSAYRGIGDPKRRDAFLEAVELSVQVAGRLGLNRMTVGAGEAVGDVDREGRIDSAVEALKAAVEEVAEAEVTLLLDPFDLPPGRSKPLLATVDEAAEVVKAVDSKLVRLRLDAGGEAGLIGKYRDVIGHHRVSVPADGPKGESGLALVLKAIHDAGNNEPIGLTSRPSAGPEAAIAAIRRADAAAKGL